MFYDDVSYLYLLIETYTWKLISLTKEYSKDSDNSKLISRPNADLFHESGIEVSYLFHINNQMTMLPLKITFESRKATASRLGLAPKINWSSVSFRRSQQYQKLKHSLEDIKMQGLHLCTVIMSMALELMNTNLEQGMWLIETGAHLKIHSTVCHK